MNSVWSHVLKKQEENPAKTQQRTWEKHLDLYLIHLLFKLQQKCYQWKGGWRQSEGSLPDYIRTSVHKSLHLLPMLMKSRWLEVVARCFIIWGVYLWQVGKQSYKWPNQMWSQYFTIMMFDLKSSCLNKKYLCLQKIHWSQLTDKVKNDILMSAHKLNVKLFFRGIIIRYRIYQGSYVWGFGAFSSIRPSTFFSKWDVQFSFFESVF